MADLWHHVVHGLDDWSFVLREDRVRRGDSVQHGKLPRSGEHWSVGDKALLVGHGGLVRHLGNQD